MIRKILLAVAGLAAAAVLIALLFVGSKIRAFDASVARTWDVTPPAITASTDPAIVARGQHLAESIGGCIECHGEHAEGKLGEDLGPLGEVHGPNLTRGGMGAVYSDAELGRAVRHGIKKTGHTVLFMPSHDLEWWPDDDLQAVVSWVRAQPDSPNAVPPSKIAPLGKLLDRVDAIPLDIARRIDHDYQRAASVTPAPTADYGANLIRLCSGCHGATFSGGPIPGVPPDIPPPGNLTPHATGLKDWTYAEFVRLLNEGIKRDGTPLHEFMPIRTLKTMNDVEKEAMWLAFQALEPAEYGGR